MTSLACNIPQKGFRRISRWLIDGHRTQPCDGPTEKREEMRSPSTCASSCVSETRSTRRHSPTIARCTNDALVVSMVMGVPNQGPRLDTPDSDCIMDAIYITTSVEGIPKTVNPRSLSDSAEIQKRTPTVLPEGSDYCVEWSVPYFSFSCIASRRPGDISDARHVTYIIIHTLFADALGPDRYNVSLKSIPWDAWLGAIQKLPDLQGIAVHNQMMGRDSQILLKKFVTHLRGLWAGIDDLLEVRANQLVDDVWTTVELDKVAGSVSEMSDDVASSSTVFDPED